MFTNREALALIDRLRAEAKTVVFTNGVFDLLHPGHVRYLREARRLGDALIVGVNSDRSVRANKGQDRPLTPEAERAEILVALECVDGAVIFDEDTPHDLILTLQPDVLVKGADWGENAIVGREIVEARGGGLCGFPLSQGIRRVASWKRSDRRGKSNGLERPSETNAASPTLPPHRRNRDDLFRLRLWATLEVSEPLR